MKKIMLIIAFTAIGSIAMTSCTRENTCECTTTDSNGDKKTSKTVITGTRKKAQEECDKKDSDPILGPKTDCEITGDF